MVWRVKVHFLKYSYLIIPVLLFGKTIPHWVTLSKIFWAHVWINFCTLLCTTDLYCLYANTTVPCLLEFYSLVIRGGKSSNIVLFQNCFGSSRSFAYPCKFYSHRVKSLPQKKAVWILRAIASGLQISLWCATKTTTEISNSWAWYIYWFIQNFFNFFQLSFILFTVQILHLICQIIPSVFNSLILL